MKRTILIAAAALALAACGSSTRKKAASADRAATETRSPDMHTAETSLDYKGTYTGTFPAADCPGIEMTLRLRDDGKYDLHMKYIDRRTEFDEQGTYTVEDNLLTLRPSDGDEPDYYKVEENRLRLLDAARQPITGELAAHYILTKQND
ncbi:copper resistance protein NlpE [Alistipes sp.]|uniref:copper resistance protein NlpE n=1 Tax=Alistipes sp. TaxID=1872444 RepID=UPI003AF0B91A